MTKNCENCVHLEWGFGDINDPEGWVCNAKEYNTNSEEKRHLDKLDDLNYRLKAKKCFEPFIHGGSDETR
jgi:hypothetical protein